MVVDPVCLTHGRRKSEHWCVQCCICFKDLKPEDCYVGPDGRKWDICNDCMEMEAKASETKND